MKKKIIRIGRNILIAVLAIVLVIGLIGAVYIWWSGQNQTPVSTPVTDESEIVSYDRPDVVPRAPGEGVPIGAAVQTITRQVEPGKNASITVRSHPESTCSIEVFYIDESEASDTGLKPKKTDRLGMVSWAWTVLPNAPIGESKTEIICEKGEESAFVVGHYLVKNPNQ